MAWSNSKVFACFLLDALGNTSAWDLDTAGDVPKVALFDNSITPSNTVAIASSAYAAGVWASGGVSDASGWPAAGRPLASVTWAQASATLTYDAADTVSANSTTTLASVYGCLVYDDTITTPVADPGLSYNFFGGTNSVTSGTFTVVWNASGIFTIAA